jgi:DNA mismatch repair ATPase MutL
MVGLKPMAFLCFELPPGTFDVNVTPDKRSVFIQKEVAIMNALGQVRCCYSCC